MNPNNTSHIHGHANPDIVAALTQQLANGVSFNLPTPQEVSLAKHIVERIPSVDRVRFTNSGTEAMMNAIRAAWATTGRPKIAKFEGPYHGSYPGVDFSLEPNESEAGPADQPSSAAASPGTPAAIIENTIILPFNKPAEVEAIVRRHAKELAAVIVEPIPSNLSWIQPQPGFLEFLRELTRSLGILLISDEIVDFRLAYQGIQATHGIEPDLTTLGKFVGGGFPFGILGGKLEVMEAFDPARPGGHIQHSGSFNGNPMSTTAGLIALEKLTAVGDRPHQHAGRRPAPGAARSDRGRALPCHGDRDGFAAVLLSHGAPGRAVGAHRLPLDGGRPRRRAGASGAQAGDARGGDRQRRRTDEPDDGDHPGRPRGVSCGGRSGDAQGPRSGLDAAPPTTARAARPTAIREVPVSVEAPPVTTDIEATYRARTPKSAELFERATKSLPGGSTRTTIYFEPYPPYMERGVGARVIDVDGNSYLDLLGNYTSLILGHAHPAVVAAVIAQVERGSAFGAPSEVEVALAEEIEARVESVDEVRFTNSGTEATMLALRLARAHTGRSLIAKFVGAYHGTHDWAFARTPGVPQAVNDLVLELPFDDEDWVRRALGRRERELAAIIIEPVLGAGGVRPARPEFLAFLRDLTTASGAVLIFDEVISFRIGRHGAQGVFGVRPDLTTFGKIVGGGYPLAALGGRDELMRHFDARRPDGLVHGGTFNGNPVAAAAGLATLTTMTAPRYIEINAFGKKLRAELAARFQEDGSDVTVSGIGSLFNLTVGAATLSPDDRATAQRRFHLALLNDGYYLAPRGMGALSVPMTWDDVASFVDAAGRSAAAVLQPQ